MTWSPPSWGEPALSLSKGRGPGGWSKGLWSTNARLVERRREAAMKGWKRAWKIALIEKSNPEWRDRYGELA